MPPSRIDERLSKLESELKRLFCNKNKLKVKPNITSFQPKTLEKLQDTLSVVFANSDKNLGPVAVTLDRYIKDALKHLLDSSTYELLSEDEAFERDAALRTDIFKWTVEWRPQIGDDVVEFLRKKFDTMYQRRSFWVLLSPVQASQKPHQNQTSGLRLCKHSTWLGTVDQ